MLVPQNAANIELKYIKALCDAYAQALGRQNVTEADVPSLPVHFSKDSSNQRKAYYNTESIEHHAYIQIDKEMQLVSEFAKD